MIYQPVLLLLSKTCSQNVLHTQESDSIVIFLTDYLQKIEFLISRWDGIARLQGIVYALYFKKKTALGLIEPRPYAG